MADEKGVSYLAILVPVVVLIVFVLSGIFLGQTIIKTQGQPAQVACTQEAKICPDGSSVSRTGPTCEFTACPVSGIQGWKIYSDINVGFTFQYPDTFNTTFASFQQVPAATVIAQSNAKVDSKGCYIVQALNPQTSQISVGGIPFCLTDSQDVGAGQLYHSYDYTTFRNGNYIVVEYIVHTSNGCGAYQGTANYQGCQDFMSNYNSIVLKPIQDSIATFRFTK